MRFPGLEWLRPASRPAPPPPRSPRPPRRDQAPPPLPRPHARVRGAPGNAFTPTRPRQGRRSLVGRRAELERVVQALREERAHVVLYSERGRGKTSLSNLAADILRADKVIVARYTCEADSSFDSIMRGLAANLPPALLAVPAGSEAGEGCEAALPRTGIRPRDVVQFPSRLTCPALVCIVDEFDRVEDARTRTTLADTIKQLSDSGAPLHFMIVGVSENLEQILGQHPSIQRNLAAIHLPLLTDGEVCEIIQRGGAQTGFEFPRVALARITVLARGNPYMAQLLGMRLVQAASRRNDTAVSDKDFDAAIARMVLEAAPRDVETYATLTADGRDAEAVSALRRIATAEQDPWGRLRISVDPDGSVTIGSRPVPARVWRTIEAAGLLRPVGKGTGVYTFAERSLMHYIQLLAAGSLVQPERVGRAVEPVQ